MKKQTNKISLLLAGVLASLFVGTQIKANDLQDSWRGGGALADSTQSQESSLLQTSKKVLLKVKPHRIQSHFSPDSNSQAVDIYRQDRILNALEIIKDDEGKEWVKIGENEFVILEGLEAIKEQEVKSADGLEPRQFGENDFSVKYRFHIDNEGVTFESLGINEEWLQESIVHYNIQDLSVENLQNIVDIISYYMQSHGYPSATVYIPSQEIDENNTMQINITLGKFGKFVIADNSGIKENAIKSKLSTNLKGKILTTKEVEDNVFKVNEMAGAEAIALLQAGENYQETDIVLYVADTVKASAILYADNYGLKSSGQNRLGVSFGLNSVMGYGDSFSGFAQITDELQKAYGASYSFFINNLKITPRISKTNYSLGGEYEALGAVGESTNLGVDLQYPLFLNAENGLFLHAGADRKRLRDAYERYDIEYLKKSNVFYGGFRGYHNRPKNILNWDLRFYAGEIKPKSRYSELSNTNGSFQKLVLHADNSYYFSQSMTLLTNVSYQQSLGGKKKLDSSESSYLGGAYGVRAYRSGEADADNTLYGMLGVRFKTPLDNFYVTPFYEAGYAWNEDKEYEEYFMDSAGLELLYLKPNSFYIKVDLANALTKFEYDGKRRARIYAGMGIYF